MAETHEPIVAECVSCNWQTQDHLRHISFPLWSNAQADRHRAAGHDVRPVEVKP